MLPTLRSGDHLLGFRSRSPRPGQIVCFLHPERDDFWMVKRVIAVRGDVVEIRDGDITVNATASRHVVEDLRPMTRNGRWQVQDGEMFVLSDAHHLTGADSRRFGPVTTQDSYVMIWPRR